MSDKSVGLYLGLPIEGPVSVLKLYNKHETFECFFLINIFITILPLFSLITFLLLIILWQNIFLFMTHLQYVQHSNFHVQYTGAIYWPKFILLNTALTVTGTVLVWTKLRFNPTVRGAFKARPEQKLCQVIQYMYIYFLILVDREGLKK